MNPASGALPTVPQIAARWRSPHAHRAHPRVPNRPRAAGTNHRVDLVRARDPDATTVLGDRLPGRIDAASASSPSWRVIELLICTGHPVSNPATSSACKLGYRPVLLRVTSGARTGGRWSPGSSGGCAASESATRTEILPTRAAQRSSRRWPALARARYPVGRVEAAPDQSPRGSAATESRVSLSERSGDGHYCGRSGR